jgi:hypothetical protein
MGVIFQSILVMVKKSLLDNNKLPLNITASSSARTLDLNQAAYTLTVKRYDVNCIGVSLYNCLPKELKMIDNLKVFSSRLKSYLLTKNESLCGDLQISTRNMIL